MSRSFGKNERREAERAARAGRSKPKGSWWQQTKAAYGDQWAEISAVTKAFYNYTCQLCGTRCPPPFSKNLHVHHRRSAGKQGSTNDPRNLTVWCALCHTNHHPHMRKAR